MTIWLLALILIGALVAIGYTQGAIRVGLSFFGIILGALLALPLAKLVRPAVVALGVSNLALQWILPPIIVFIIISAAVKVGALALHKKVDVYYKYKAGDLRASLWERLNARLGACLGVLNALGYLVLISWLIWVFSYSTVQFASGDSDPKMMRLLNQLGRDLQATGMAKVARAIDPMPAAYYQTVNLAALLYQNSLLEARLSRYPGFLGLGERPEFQTLGADQDFAEMRLRRAPISAVLANPNVNTIVNNKAELKTIWEAVEPNMKDLESFLEKGVSEKFSDPVLGRWHFDVNGSMMEYRKMKPNLPSREMQKFRAFVTGSYSKAGLVIMPDGKVAIKKLPQAKSNGAVEPQDFASTWKSVGSEYDFTLGTFGERHAKLESGRLYMPGEGLSLVFLPED